MAEATQYIWKHQELVTLMVKEKGIHEGRWMLLVGYGMVPGNFGPNDAELSPGMVVAITGIGIQRETPGQAAPEALVVDAALVNPAPGSAARDQPALSEQLSRPARSSRRGGKRSTEVK